MKRRRILASALSAPVVLAGPLRGAGAQEPFGAADARAAELDQLHALVIADRERVLFAKAYRGPALGRPANVKSVSKTIVAILTGIAIERGVLPDSEARLGDMAPDLIPTDADPRVGDITMANLLTMQAGLERTSGRNYGGWVQSGNWVANALSRPLVAEPGEQFLYSTGSFHILGAVIAHRAERSLLSLAREWLGRPLGIDVPPWTRDPQGFYMGGNNMAFTPEALARIGQTMLANGRWQGQPVIPEGWIATSWQPRTRSPFSGHTYGFGWFLAEDRGVQVAYARGYGGQMLYVVPERGITVAITSDETRPARSRGYVSDLHRLLAVDILPEA